MVAALGECQAAFIVNSGPARPSLKGNELGRDSLMKSVAGPTLLALCLYMLVGFTAMKAHASEYFIYYDAKGGLVVSNQKPPPDSKIIKQQTLPDLADVETAQVQERNDQRPNGNANPLKPSNEE
jgi:hypothetical protein